MKIALDYNAALRQPAGIGRYTRELVRAFLRLNTGAELVLFYAARDLPPDHPGLHALRELQAEFAQVRAARIPLGERWLTIVWQRARLPLPVERWTGPVDLVHAPDFVLPPVRRAPTLLTVHDLTFRIHPETAHANLRRYLDRAVPRSLRRATHVVVDSESSRRDLERLMQVPPAKVSVLYPGVGQHFRRVTAEDKLAAVRHKYELPEQFLFFIGTLEPRKNLERLMQAFERVRSTQHVPPFELVLGGKPGWLSAPILERARHTPGVRLLGPIAEDDLPALYTLASGCVYPSLYEGFGFPPLEALGCGTPALVANTSSLPEVVSDLGILVDPMDITAIAHGIERLLTEQTLWMEAATRGPSQAAKFTWERAAEQLWHIYQTIGQTTTP
ncbi:MAG: glycosyltransferase family 4 protein [Chloroflexota bacterium]|nr:glycosyltransferase family 4 protein [Chloroflexota bacterium]